jgi:hypothetical protein
MLLLFFGAFSFHFRHTLSSFTKNYCRPTADHSADYTYCSLFNSSKLMALRRSESSNGMRGVQS